MSDTVSSKVRNHYDSVAMRYDVGFKKAESRWRFHDLATWEHINRFFPKAGKLLDAGCGTGRWALRLARMGWYVTGVDISKKMLEVAKRKASNLGVSDRVEFVAGDVTELCGLQCESFDAILSQGCVLSYCGDAAKALSEFHRVAKSGACLIADVDCRFSVAASYWRKQGDFLAATQMLDTGDGLGGAAKSAERFPIHAFMPEELHRLLAETGWRLAVMVGKTVTPTLIGKECFKQLLETSEGFAELREMETRLRHQTNLIGCATNLEVAAFVP